MFEVPFEVATIAAPDRTVVYVAGEIDIATAPQFTAALENLEAAVPVVVDMNAVTFMGSAGLAALVAARKRRSNGGATLHVQHPSDIVLRILQIAQLDSLLDANAPVRDPGQRRLNA